MSDDALATCHIPEPATGLEARFSLALVTAMALGGRDTSAVSSFDDALCRDPELVALRDRVEVHGDPGRARGTAEVVITRHDGRAHAAAWDAARPETDLDAQWQRTGAKFTALAAPVLGQARVRQVLAMIAEFEHLADVTELVHLCAPSPAGR